jgi:hypothetical protein
MPGLRRLYAPQWVAVRTDHRGTPAQVEGTLVEAIRPLRRHYFELALSDGRALTVFRGPGTNRWYRQRA